MAPTTHDRPLCSAFLALSVDGYLAREDDGLDWLDAVAVDGEDYGFAEFFGSVDVLVMGRRTYDTVLGFAAWPYAGKRIVVVTHRPPPARHGEEFSGEAPAELLSRLGREGARRVYVDGGMLIRAFLAAGLLDDLTVSWIPVVLGRGRRLFTGDEPELRLRVDSTRSWPSGLVQVRYRLS